MTTHFEPPLQYDDADQSMCGTWFGEPSNTSGDWARVDCKKCLNNRLKIAAAHEAEERAIVAQMGDMGAFMQQEQPQ